MLVDHGCMHGDDLAHMPGQVRRAARDCGNGEIEWPLPLAVEFFRAAAMAALDRAFKHHSWNDPWVVVTW
jgi:hypothetical protein